MRFAEPWLLLILVPALVAVLAIARYGRRSVPARQHRIAVALRTLGVVLLVLAAAQPSLSLRVDDRAVLFVLDRSASVSAAARVAQERYVQIAMEAASPQDRAGVAVFGADVRVDAALSPAPVFSQVRTIVDDGATDLGGALRAGASVLPTAGSRRMVVLTDGVETAANARTAARELVESGIAIDVVLVEADNRADAVLDEIVLPQTARVGETVTATAIIRSTGSGPAEVRFRTASGIVDTLAVSLTPGTNEVSIEIPVELPGVLSVGAEIRASFDTRPENDRAQALVTVLGPAVVAIIEGEPGNGSDIGRALEAGGLVVELLASVPPPEELPAYDAVVLVNVRNPPLDATEQLAGFVEDLGRGLVVIGGDQAYGLGGYQNTELESVLPVRSNPDDLIRRQQVTEVLVIDTSGSMAACHCEGGGMGPGVTEGGVNKTDISRAGAALAIEALSDQDQIGVLAFSSGTSWVLPVAPKPDQATVDAALAQLFPAGDTEIAAALEVALAELNKIDRGLRHIVLFTDGWDPSDAALLPVARKIADAGVTLSVLGTGEGPGSVLARMAELGGGRYYPGTDLAAVPEVFVEETLTVARNLATEGTFFPALGNASQITTGLVATPPLLGYVVTKAKATATVPLEIGSGDPLLAVWQRGLGRAAAWTSDAEPRWSAQWIDWDGYVDFWGRVVRDVLPSGRDKPPELALDNGTLTIGVDAQGAPLDAVAVARVRLPSGDVAVTPLRRIGVDRFEGQIQLTGQGAYWVSTEVASGDGTSTVGSSALVSSYGQEFSFLDPDLTLAPDVAGLTGGRVDPPPEAAFDQAPAEGRTERPLWPWLAAAALFLFLFDVTLRRLVIVEDAVKAWREGVISKPVPAGAPSDHQPEPPPPPPESVNRLLRRKRR